MKTTGIILRGVGGLYMVWTKEKTAVPCRPRGVFRHKSIVPLPGDRCEILLLEDGMGRIESLEPRRNQLVRPTVCNVDAMLLVLSEAIPRSDPYLIDRLTAVAAFQGIEVLLAVNKVDITEEERLTVLYGGLFPTHRTSAVTGEGLEPLREALRGKTVVFTGNSGVGKSSLLNALCPDMNLKTGEVSTHLGRGKHTTRHVEFFSLPFDCVAVDTPGFSALDTAADIGRDSLDACFVEFRPYLAQCRFTGCLHNHVKGCAVEEAVEAGEINTVRYENYLRILEDSPGAEWEDKKRPGQA